MMSLIKFLQMCELKAEIVKCSVCSKNMRIGRVPAPQTRAVICGSVERTTFAIPFDAVPASRNLDLKSILNLRRRRTSEEDDKRKKNGFWICLIYSLYINEITITQQKET
ncbi:uncharacterized protein LOC126341466 [Schistocerca gregaria]|uniref:uncharacterized protein LOC126341466 n=1 Tax=Schistocerca gregaria TaxID=7010 RepID=UPI00211F196A|nr:uncharacterized protein LOC126341466 [Schistocerca gregaria]